ncbi:MAG: hypothetical protein LLF76_09865 [Planctomycetaceae bacterium]|nr:hypothetical protein [Planctomycetaceae bacterium]
MKQTCRNCRYFHLPSERSVNGQCRRFPPRLLIVTERAGQSLQDLFVSVSSGSWCGEFIPIQNR